MAVIIGTSGPDIRNGTSLDDTISGLGGDDRLDGRAGDDLLQGGGGDDTLLGREGADELHGGVGDDRLVTSQGDPEGPFGLNQLHGEEGDDILEVRVGDIADGGTGYDRIYVDLGFRSSAFVDLRVLEGDDFEDIEGTLIRDVEAGRFSLTAGQDFARVGTGGFEIFAQDGADIVITHSAARVDGGAGSDLINGSKRVNRLDGGADGDTIKGGGGYDTLQGQGGDDAIVGSGQISGGAGDDVITVNGVSEVNGDAGADRIKFMTLAALGSTVVTADGDVVDLGKIDANTSLVGDQAFQLVGAFSGQAGQMTVAWDGSTYTEVSVDVNGDGEADAVLRISDETVDPGGWVL